MLGSNGAIKVNGFALEEDLAFAAGHNPADHLDQGRFPGAVLADQGMNLAIVEVKLHLFQGVDTPIAFGYAIYSEKLVAVLCHSGSVLCA